MAAGSILALGLRWEDVDVERCGGRFLLMGKGDGLKGGMRAFPRWEGRGGGRRGLEGGQQGRGRMEMV
jgi:hypothetical protein